MSAAGQPQRGEQTRDATADNDGVEGIYDSSLVITKLFITRASVALE